MPLRLLKHHRVSRVLLGLLVVLGLLVTHRFRDQQARAVTRAHPEVLVGVVTPTRRDLDIKLALTAAILPAQQAAIVSTMSGSIRTR